MYLKWLINSRNGERVPVREAINVFGTTKYTDSQIQAILSRERWTFTPIAGTPTALQGVELLQAQEEWSHALRSRQVHA